MNAERFDALAQSIVQRLSRRAALALPLGGALASAGILNADAKKKKKKCKKKCGPCRKCKKGKCKPKGDGLDCGDCSQCQGGVCTLLCAAGEQCLANNSCAQTCEEDAQCNMGVGCACNEDDGGDPVCRVVVGVDDCPSLQECLTTADCDAGTVCSTVCADDGRCVPLCP